MDIGCIECGEESNLVGIFDTAEEASSALTEEAAIQRENWTGQHYFELYEYDPSTKTSKLVEW